MLNWYHSAAQKPPVSPLDPTVRVPTLLLWGARDRFLGQEMAATSIALCERGELVILKRRPTGYTRKSQLA